MTSTGADLATISPGWVGSAAFALVLAGLALLRLRS